MATVADRIMKRAKSRRDDAVFTPKDFLDLGSRSAVDKALSRLVKGGSLRRIGRGFYDRPRQSDILRRPAPPSLDAVVDALRRRSNMIIIGSDLAAANALGLTTAVPTRPQYVAERKLADITIGNRRVEFKRAKAALLPWLDSPAASVVQAIFWIIQTHPDDDHVAVAQLRRRASPRAKRALAKGLPHLPAWAVPMARQVARRGSTAPR